MLSRGLISGHWSRERQTGGSDFRSTMSPRFQGDALDHNLQLVETLREVADGVGALDVTLDDATLARLDDAFPPGVAEGDRYAAAQMGMLDSER